MDGILAGSFIGGIVVLTINFFVAKEFERIAELKGHSEKQFFWCTFLLGIVGMLMVVALPDRSNTQPQQTVQVITAAQTLDTKQTSDELPDL